MEIELEQAQGNMRVIFYGDMDEYSVSKVRSRIDDAILAASGLRCVIFDLRGVSFVDSTALGFVLGRYKKLRKMHAELVLANVSRQVNRIFSASGIYRYVPIVE